MTTECTGVYIDGRITLNAPLNLPKYTPVKLTVSDEPIESIANMETPKLPHETEAEFIARLNQIAAVRKFLELASQTQISLKGERLSRDELYDRH